MKKCKLLAVSVVVSFSLLSAPAISGPTKKTKPEVEQVASEQSFSEWFFGLFDF